MHLIGPSTANVLVTGETGTGKELIARHVHKLSPRADGPFVAVNCGAFSEGLLESELFGHERGSFTGATVARAGWFEAARGGTLFLDEIGDLPFAMQVKLLRVLQERQVVRLGSRSPVAIDVRVVAATNVNLEDAVATGRFREDLYYRLQVATLHVPPLRERPGDILPLAQYFLGVYGERLGLKDPALSAEAIDVLVSGHSWPGNTRELENVIHHALLVCRENVVRPEDLRLFPLGLRIAASGRVHPFEALRDALLTVFEGGRPNLYSEIETAITRTAYEFCHRNQVQTARLLGISRNIVRAKLMQCGELPTADSAVRGNNHSAQHSNLGYLVPNWNSNCRFDSGRRVVLPTFSESVLAWKCVRAERPQPPRPASSCDHDRSLSMACKTEGYN